MVSICLYITHLIFTLLITLPNLLCVISQECGCQSPPPPPPPPQPQPPQPLTFLDQRLAVVFPVIQKFKNTITSDPLGITQTWVGSDICTYQGFYCDHPPDNLTALTLAAVDFNGFNLAAPSLDGFIDQLPDLALFHANSNNFSGNISPNISKLKFLYELDLSNNKFSGGFPMTILEIAGLSFLDLRFNFFTGSVPYQIFIQKLDVLFINNNNFSQNLPQNLGSTPAVYLTFANNKFTGPIPKSIGKTSQTLIEVLFLNNQLSGCLPYELGFLRKATVIDAGNNLITGQLPCSLGCLEAVEQLNFAGNLLYGTVPEVVCGLGNLLNLSLSYNYFTRVGPMCWKLIKSGVLDVRKNCIRGLPDQRSTAECASFWWHPRNCMCAASYSTIPCKLPYSYSHVPPHPPSKRPNRHLISYSALSRHRL